MAQFVKGKNIRNKTILYIAIMIVASLTIVGGFFWYDSQKEIHIFVHAPASKENSCIKIWLDNELVFNKNYPPTTSPPFRTQERDYVKRIANGPNFEITVSDNDMLRDTKTFSVFQGNVIEISFGDSIIIIQSKTKPLYIIPPY